MSEPRRQEYKRQSDDGEKSNPAISHPSPDQPNARRQSLRFTLLQASLKFTRSRMFAWHFIVSSHRTLLSSPFRTTHSGPLIACSTAISTDQLEEIFPSLRVGDKNESVRLIRSPLPVELEVKRGFASGTPGRRVNDANSPRMRGDESLRSVLCDSREKGRM